MNEQNKANEIIRLIEVLDSREESIQRKKYHLDLLKSFDVMYQSIQKRINKGCVVVKNMVLGFIPITSKKQLDELAINRLENEMVEIENKTWNEKKYYEAWNKRCKEEEIDTDNVTRECNTDFDKITKEAEKITSDLMLQEILKKYSNASNDQKIKNKHFLVLKKHISNNNRAKNKR